MKSGYPAMGIKVYIYKHGILYPFNVSVNGMVLSFKKIPIDKSFVNAIIVLS